MESGSFRQKNRVGRARANAWRLVAALILPGASWAAELDAPVPPDFTHERRIGDFVVRVSQRPVTFEVRSAGGGEPLLEPPPGGPALLVASATESVRSQYGGYHFEQETEAEAAAWTVAKAVDDGGGWNLELALRPTLGMGSGSAGVMALRFEPGGDGTLSVRLQAPAGHALNRLRVRFAARDSEDYLGFGSQANRISHRGRTVPIWVSEQGIGRTDFPLRFPFTGTTTDAYFPVPYFLSTRGYGLLVDSTARSVFDLGSTRRRGQVQLEIWDVRAGLYVFAGPRPGDVIRRLTAVTGRPRLLPDWAFGVWVAIQGGSDAIRRRLEALGQAGAPVDAVWVQDWMGARDRPYGYGLRYRWTPDRSLYPDLEDLIAGLHRQGVRFVGYFNTFLEPSTPEFKECADAGWLVRRADEEPYLQKVSVFSAGLLDMSDPDARAHLAGYLRSAIRMGMDGWMADFGEWLPWDARIRAPEGSPLWHNRYPVEWARLCRETFLRERPDGDFVVFHRSGFTGSVAWVDMVWGGDQNTSWSPDDGLPTVLPIGLNLGLSGVPLYHFDGGGFASLVSFPRGPQLFKRWIEAAAMSPLMRTHEGYLRRFNVQPDSSPGVLEHFGRMARLHRWLQPKLVAAAREASRTGLPIMRHMWLQYPEDAVCLQAKQQYLLGPDVLAAPVSRPDQTHQRVYFPSGTRWIHWRTRRAYQGPGWHEIPVPLGCPALFVAEGREPAGRPD